MKFCRDLFWEDSPSPSFKGHFQSPFADACLPWDPLFFTSRCSGLSCVWELHLAGVHPHTGSSSDTPQRRCSRRFCEKDQIPLSPRDYVTSRWGRGTDHRLRSGCTSRGDAAANDAQTLLQWLPWLEGCARTVDARYRLSSVTGTGQHQQWSCSGVQGGPQLHLCRTPWNTLFSAS